MAFGNAGKREAIFGLGHVHRGRDVVGEATVLVKVDDQQTTILYQCWFMSSGGPTHALSQYWERRSASYRCLTICSPDAMGLVGCIESTVQHSGLIYEKAGRVPCSRSR